MSFIKEVNSLLSSRDKKLFLSLFILSFIVSIVESISISGMMFFISTVTNFHFIGQTKYYKFITSMLGFSDSQKVILFLGIAVVCLYLFRGFLNIFLIWSTSQISLGVGRNASLKVFNNFLDFYYSDLSTSNSAHISQALFSYSNALASVSLGFVGVISELLTLFCIYVMLLWINFKMTLYLTLFLSLMVIIVIKFFSKKLAEAGNKNHKYVEEMYKVFTEVYWNFKLIKLHGNADGFMNQFSIANKESLRANVLNNLLQNIPRFFLETFGFLVLVLMVIYVIYVYGNPDFVIPIVSIYALAFYRFLPSVTKILSSYNQIVFNKGSVALLANFFQTKPEFLGSESICFKHKLELKNLTFYYNKNRVILDRINFSLYKGQRIAFVGPSGSGKSTMADLIMGILKPCEGQIIVDEQYITKDNLRSWRLKIGYIPQQIYLFDGTVADNVTFGREYDEQKLISALKKSNIYDFLLMQDGLATRVGEGGVKISGGQKQRIAIARALYGDPEVLVLDEATSALDSKTEDLIMSEIYKVNEDKTLVVIAHRLTTIEKCDIVYKIADGQVEIAKRDQIQLDRNSIQQAPHMQTYP